MALKVKREVIKKAELRKIFTRLSKKLKAEKLPVKDVILFGSYAHGTPDGDSDIDVALVVFGKITAKVKKDFDNIHYLVKSVNVKLEPHVMSTGDYNNRWSSIAGEVRKHGIKMS